MFKLALISYAKHLKDWRDCNKHVKISKEKNKTRDILIEEKPKKGN